MDISLFQKEIKIVKRIRKYYHINIYAIREGK